jgi:hypothetical protein
MNKQIQRLAEQARFMAEETINKKISKNAELDAFAEKFAQLIVQECAELFVDRKYMVLNPLEPFADERVRALKAHDRDTVKTIKQHFGVEE